MRRKKIKSKLVTNTPEKMELGEGTTRKRR